jgi:hypothetical protein
MMAVPRRAAPVGKARGRCQALWYWYFLLTSAGNWYLGNGFFCEVTGLTLPSFQINQHEGRGNLIRRSKCDQIFDKQTRRGFYSKVKEKPAPLLHERRRCE